MSLLLSQLVPIVAPEADDITIETVNLIDKIKKFFAKKA
mgnify:CR=1 FL=1